jgi:hypothetical protein
MPNALRGQLSPSPSLNFLNVIRLHRVHEVLSEGCGLWVEWGGSETTLTWFLRAIYMSSKLRVKLWCPSKTNNTVES